MLFQQSLKKLRRYPIAPVLIVIYLACAAWFLASFLSGAKRPAETNWAERVEAGKVPGLNDFVDVGLYKGGIFHATVIGLLILSAPLWIKLTKPEPTKVWAARKRGDGISLGNRTFWTWLIVIVVLAMPVRFIRLNDSFWGDESWAVERYGQGYFVAGEDGIQGELVFKPSKWKQAFFDDRGGGSNHQLQTVTGRLIDTWWKQANGLPPWAVVEWTYRIPSLLAGLGAMFMAGLLLRRLGYPIAGLAAAALFAVHPWFVRFSVEARGYAPMVALLMVCMWALVGAMKYGRWRDWLLLVALEFLTCYAWKGAPFPLLALNAVAVVAILREAWAPRKDLAGGASALTRMVVLNLIVAGIFVHIIWPSHLQVAHYWERSSFLKGATFDLVWTKSYLSYLAVGSELFDQYSIVPENFSVETLWGGRREISWVVIASLVGVFVSGLFYGLRTSWVATCLVASPLVAVFMVVSYFWFIRDAGLLRPYAYFGIAGSVFLGALGVEGIGVLLGRWRTGRPVKGPAIVAGALVAGYAVVVTPVTTALVARRVEPLREAWEVTRGQHEEAGYHGPSRIHTIYHWRHSRLYDPRANLHARDHESIRQIMADARAVGDELYVVVGNLLHMHHVQPDVLELMYDSSEFEAIEEFWSLHPTCSLLAFRMLPQRRSIEQEPESAAGS